MKFNLSKIFIFLGLIIILSSIIHIFISNKNVYKGKQKAINLENAIKELSYIENNFKMKKDDNRENNNKKNDRDIESKDTDNQIKEENIIIDGEIGILRIDKLNVITPIFKDTSQKSLSNGVGLLEETSYPSNEKSCITAIAGHRGGKNDFNSFLNVDKLRNGDEIKITIPDMELIYKVYDKKIIEPTNWEEFDLEKGKNKLVLITCHPYPHNYQRLLIICKLDRFNLYKQKIKPL